MVISHLEPQRVMEYFEAISAIPRATGNEKNISDFLVKFAKDRNLEVIQDKFYNVIIKKPAAKGYEQADPVLLQGHMDMVSEANKGSSHNFKTDPIALRVDGNFIKATDTTLGADNGIAVAMIMAILDDTTIAHPAIEVLITTDEESGMTGALGFDPQHLKARQMINLDTEETQMLYASCAGGATVALSVPFYTESITGQGYKITVKGLMGGHSGMQIHEQKANANKILGRVLANILKVIPFNLVSLEGGSKENAIPRESEAIIFIAPEQSKALKTEIDIITKILQKEFTIADPGLIVILEEVKVTDPVMDQLSTQRIVHTLNLYSYGVRQMSLSIVGLVQTSLNPGILRTQNHMVTITSLVRSSLLSEQNQLILELDSLAKLVGGTLDIFDEFPAWEYNLKSQLRDIAIEVGSKEFGKPIDVKAVHAGLECGIIGEKFPDGFDAISIGPNIYDPHTPNEHLDIISVKDTYNWLLKILMALK